MSGVDASNDPQLGHDRAEHGLLRSLLLHLVPGAVFLLLYLAVFGPLAARLGLPRQAGVVLCVVLGRFPLLLGFLAYTGYRRSGRPSLQGVVRYRRKLPARELAPLVAALFLWALLVIALLSWVDDLLLQKLFFWVPASLLPEAELSRYSMSVLLATQLASLLASGLLAPVAEEMYFRGFLLPRLSWMGRWAPVWNTVLFNLYHFQSPWRVVSRTVFTLPMVYAVWRKRSLSIGIWWHCLGNVLGELIALLGLWQVLAA